MTAALKVVGADENALLLLLICAWISRPTRTVHTDAGAVCTLLRAHSSGGRIVLISLLSSKKRRSRALASPELIVGLSDREVALGLTRCLELSYQGDNKRLQP